MTVSELEEIEQLVDLAQTEQQALRELGASMNRLRLAQHAKARLEELDGETVRSVYAQRGATGVRCA